MANIEILLSHFTLRQSHTLIYIAPNAYHPAATAISACAYVPRGYRASRDTSPPYVVLCGSPSG